jgi:acyl-CoA synthetase (AMP-forming)/AMP-acid ligase II
VAGIAELVSIHAQDRPGAVAVKVVRGDQLTYGGLDRRSNRLARALVDLGVAPGDTVAVVCCDAHAPDLLVAHLAAVKTGAVTTVLPLDLAGGARASVVLACAEGVGACRAAGVRGLVVGDAMGVVWWKALELRQSAARFHCPAAAADAPGAAEPASLPVSLENGGLLHALPLSTSLGLHTVALAALAAGVPQILQAPFDPATFSRLLPAAPTACLLPHQVDQLPAGSQWITAPPGVCWRHPVTVDVDAEGGFGVGLAAAALSA